MARLYTIIDCYSIRTNNDNGSDRRPFCLPWRRLQRKVCYWASLGSGQRYKECQMAECDLYLWRPDDTADGLHIPATEEGNATNRSVSCSTSWQSCAWAQFSGSRIISLIIRKLQNSVSADGKKRTEDNEVQKLISPTLWKFSRSHLRIDS
jgi:hypothetical protein